MTTFRLILGSLFLLFGVFIFCAEVIGIFKFRYVLNRMHAAAMGDTLGIGSCFIGLMILSGFNFTTLKLCFALVFMWFSSPTASHLIAKMEYDTNEEQPAPYEQISLDRKEEN